MAQYSIDQLIINSPWLEPSSYWAYHRQTRFFTKAAGTAAGRIRDRDSRGEVL